MFIRAANTKPSSSKKKSSTAGSTNSSNSSSGSSHHSGTTTGARGHTLSSPRASANIRRSPRFATRQTGGGAGSSASNVTAATGGHVQPLSSPTSDNKARVNNFTGAFLMLVLQCH